MALSFEDFGAKMRKLAEALPERVNTAKKQIAKTVHNDLLTVTDVDTGEAMSNWIINPNTASTDVRAPFAPSPRGRFRKAGWEHQTPPDVTRAANIGPAQSQADAELVAIKPGDSIHITNNVEHIVYMDEGTPGMSAKNFARREQIIAEGALDRVRILQD